MPKEIILDKQTFEALAIDTRVDILKALKERNKTASELSKEMNLAVSTISEHLDKMKKANLVKRKGDHRKWVYYQLTDKGRNIIAPKSTSVFVFALSLSLFMLVMGIYWFDVSGGMITEAVYSGPSFSKGLGNGMVAGAPTAGSEAPKLDIPSEENTAPLSEEATLSYESITTGELPWLPNLATIFVAIGGGLLAATFIWWFKK